MKYLCLRHLYVVQEEPEVASRMWDSAMSQGEKLLRAGNWSGARTFFGFAFEVVLVRLQAGRSYSVSSRFSEEHLTDAARIFSTCLCQLEQFDEAQEILKYVHNYLLAESIHTFDTHDAKRAHIRLIEEFLKRSTSLMRFRGFPSQAETTLLLSNRLTTRIKRECLH